MADILGLATALRAATTIIKFVFVFVSSAMLQQNSTLKRLAWSGSSVHSTAVPRYIAGLLDGDITHHPGAIKMKFHVETAALKCSGTDLSRWMHVYHLAR